MKFLLVTALASLQLTLASPFNSRPFDEALARRQDNGNVSTSPLQIDLGYAIYKGLADNVNNIDQWLGIRFAAAPVGTLRWQAPQAPAVNRSTIVAATKFASQCPQSPLNTGTGAAPSVGSEDCLFLNVYAPKEAKNLPVLVWVHGGGYGQGNGQQNLTTIINTNNGSFLGVSIQYRLGAFGFLSSDEVDRFGSVNAGIRDMTFALQWVQSYIHLFGGDASKVTISGESAGGGGIMLQTMVYGGALGTSLFTNAIASSPYLPMQYGYKDFVPSQSYYAFANAAGCPVVNARGSPAKRTSIFQCLVAKDTATLQNASAVVSASGMYGTWGFLPVTDGKFIQQLPSQQLQQKQVNGARLLTGNNAEEGILFVPQNITTEQSLVSWIQDSFPLFTTDDISKVLRYYPSSNATDNPNAIDYATLGYTGPTAINQSAVGTGQQQRANNIYAETTFVCPSYWLAEAFSGNGRESYKFQFSVTPALHGADVASAFGGAPQNQGPDLVRAFMTIWGNFITANNPSISSALAIGASASNSTSTSSNTTSANTNETITNWPPFTIAAPHMINLNQTGGQAIETPIATLNSMVNVTVLVGPGLRNDFELVDAYSWEGGRGVRCDFWRAMGGVVPE